uniref:(California timema) hypothetical protein n=1 Tax=Timema californicum TaxID=61474 RepID=A0A7R9J2T1_TIMCA|nr:unnamed protein product [Timema californicum]
MDFEKSTIRAQLTNAEDTVVPLDQIVEDQSEKPFITIRDKNISILSAEEKNMIQNKTHEESVASSVKEGENKTVSPVPKSIMKKDTKYDQMEKEKKYELVPPDGGWGWAIMVATALSNLITIPILQSFGLLYRDTFNNLGMSATDSSVIINVNSAFGMILAYGIFILPPSFSLALNSYFKRLRGKALGFASTIMGIGPILIPPLISKLLEIYGVQGTSLILSSLALHSLIGAFLLQPIKWHLVKKEIDPEEAKAIELNAGDEQKEVLVEIGRRKSFFESARENLKMRRGSRTLTYASSIDHDMDSNSIYGLDAHMHNTEGILRRNSITSMTKEIDDGVQLSILSEKLPTSEQKVIWWSATSNGTINSTRSVKPLGGKVHEPLHEEDEDTEIQDDISKREDIFKLLDARNDAESKQEKNDSQSLDSMDSMIAMLNRSFLRRMLSRIFVALDLGLLQDPIYINIMLGMSFAISAEINFSLMTPFILGDLGFSNDRTATIMSTLGIADLVFRFLSPFVADSLGISARTMYLISLCLLVIARTTLTFFTSFESVMVVGVGLGMAKGVRVVYMGLVIPSYVKIERLASAAGLQMVLNGIFLLMFGPIIGEGTITLWRHHYLISVSMPIAWTAWARRVRGSGGRVVSSEAQRKEGRDEE